MEIGNGVACSAEQHHARLYWLCFVYCYCHANRDTCFASEVCATRFAASADGFATTAVGGVGACGNYLVWFVAKHHLLRRDSWSCAIYC